MGRTRAARGPFRLTSNVTLEPVSVGSQRWSQSNVSHRSLPCHAQLLPSLAAQKRRNATAPTDVTLSGYPAKRVDLSIPANLDRATCDGGIIRTWVPPGDDGVNAYVDTENLGMHAGQLNVTYIVDVNGDRLVIDTWHMPGTSAADLAELDAILASMRIEP